MIKQLDADFALPKLCLQKFWSTEAALSLAILSYNLTQLFQRHLGWLDRVTAATLRYRLLTTGGILSETGGVTTIRLAVQDPQKTGLVAGLIGEDDQPDPQLQCSGAKSGIERWNQDETKMERMKKPP